MSDEEKKQLDAEIEAFITGVTKGSAYLLGKMPAFGFRVLLPINGKKYIITLGEQVGQFEYLKDN
jgi:Flp pilus assembly protein TadB